MIRCLLAHTGRTLAVNLAPSSSVSDLQQYLHTATGLPLADQIILCDGHPVLPTKTLSSYGLGQEEDKLVFIYSKSLLQQTSIPDPIQLPSLSSSKESNKVGQRHNVPGATEGEEQGSHPLDNASSPLLRVLPQYKREFEAHLREAQSILAESQQRYEYCNTLVGEMEVQALAVDAAMSSVEPHYAHACRLHNEFMEQFNNRRASHEDVFENFSNDLSFLTSIELPEPLQSPPNTTHISHLLDVPTLRDLCKRCARSHKHFTSRVAELESLHAALRAEVEAVFMRAPVVDLVQLSNEIESIQNSITKDQEAIVQAIQTDCIDAQNAVQNAGINISEKTAGGSPPPAQISEVVARLESRLESHTKELLPALKHKRGDMETAAKRYVNSKNLLSADALRQLRTVSSQQSKIREMRERLAPFPQALARQDADVVKLLTVRRLPAAYKQCMAECSRRFAFGERYAALASDLAEKMGRFRQKEAAFRDSFQKHVEGLIPLDFLDKMGLLQQPPHCQVSVPGDELKRLLRVTPEDLRRFQLPWSSAHLETIVSGVSNNPQPQPQPGGKSKSATSVAASELEGGEAITEASVIATLRMENARLRAELASQVALDCIRAAELAALGPLARISRSVGQQKNKEEQEQEDEHHSSQSSKTPTWFDADTCQKFERALQAKDVLIQQLQADLSSAKQQSIAYEGRVKQLEGALSDTARQHKSMVPKTTDASSSPSLLNISSISQSQHSVGGASEGVEPEEEGSSSRLIHSGLTTCATKEEASGGNKTT